MTRPVRRQRRLVETLRITLPKDRLSLEVETQQGFGFRLVSCRPLRDPKAHSTKWRWEVLMEREAGFGPTGDLLYRQARKLENDEDRWNSALETRKT